MHRIFFLIAGVALANSDAPEPPGVIWLENPSCAGILIERNIVLSLKDCYGPKTQVVWPYKSEISYIRTDTNSELAIFILESFLPNPVELIHTSELNYLKEKMPIHFSNRIESFKNWINTLGDAEFTVFYGPDPLEGSPVLTELTPGKHRAVGMIIRGENKAMRLDPHFNFIATAIKAAPEPKLEQTQEKLLIAIPAQVVLPMSEIKLEPKREPEFKPELKPEPALIKPPESLGCSCSQVRRWRR